MKNEWTERIAELEKMVDNQRSVIESDEKLVEELTEKLKATEEEMLLWRRAGTNQTLQRQTDMRQAMSDVNKRLCELLDAEPN